MLRENSAIYSSGERNFRRVVLEVASPRKAIPQLNLHFRHFGCAHDGNENVLVASARKYFQSKVSSNDISVGRTKSVM